MRTVLIDTDIGSDCDDALALGVALGCPDALSIEAITTVSARSDRRAVIAASLLGLAGRDDIDICIGVSQSRRGRCLSAICPARTLHQMCCFTVVLRYSLPRERSAAISSGRDDRTTPLLQVACIRGG